MQWENPGSHFKTKKQSFRYKDSHNEDKTVMRRSYPLLRVVIYWKCDIFLLKEPPNWKCFWDVWHVRTSEAHALRTEITDTIKATETVKYHDHWYKVSAILHTTFSNYFLEWKCCILIKFHLKLFLRFQLTISQHWFRHWLGAKKKRRQAMEPMIHWSIYASPGFNELKNIEIIHSNAWNDD